MSKSSIAVQIICSRCKEYITKTSTKCTEKITKKWTFRGAKPVCYDCVEKALTKDKKCGKI